MAKYKFTKTIRPLEGICIESDGSVSKIQDSIISNVFGDLSVEWKTPTEPISFKPIVTSPIHKRKVGDFNHKIKQESQWNTKRKKCDLKSYVPVKPLKPRPKPKITVPLSSLENPYHGERAIHDVPPARPCGMFGITRPKPITRTAAMSFQNRD